METASTPCWMVSRRAKTVAIDFTFDPERHLYLVDGRPVPSVTQVLHSARLAADYSMVPPDVLERKRIIGEYLHKATQYLDEGSLTSRPLIRSCNRILRPTSDSWRSLAFDR